MDWWGIVLGPNFNNVGDIISALLTPIFTLAGMIALLFLIWGGIRYMTARGDPKAAESARGTITSAVIGLLIVLFSAAIFFAIGAAFEIEIFSGVFPASTAYAQINIGDTVTLGGTTIGDAFSNFGDLFTNIVRLGLAVSALVFFTMMVWSGYSFLSAGGDAEKAQMARSSLTNAGIGLVVAVLSLVIIEFITSVARTGFIF
jgi:hypothetical protein